jgi:hypothetical protein
MYLDMLKLASRLSRCVFLRNQHIFVQGYSSNSAAASWCDNSNDLESNEVQDLIFKVTRTLKILVFFFLRWSKLKRQQSLYSLL